MLINASIVTLLGMGTVFLFLLILVGVMDATRVLLPLLNRLAPEELPAQALPRAAALPAPGTGRDKAAAAIAAAYAHSGRTL